MNYRNVIEQMKRRGRHSEADEYRDSLKHHGIQEHEHANPYDVVGGVAFTKAGEKAEESYRYLKEEERREDRREEAEQQRREEERRECELQAQRYEESRPGPAKPS